MTPTLRTVVALCGALLALSACNIDVDNCRSDGICTGTHVSSTSTGASQADIDASCVPFCNRMVNCGLVSAAEQSSCLSYCSTQYRANPQLTESGCSCAVHSFCYESAQLEQDMCNGAPIPPTGYVPPDAGSSTGGSTGGGIDAGASACTRNLDCAYNQDCVRGACLSRCHADCDCATGQVCGSDAYCH